jgi:hypothetical protein
MARRLDIGQQDRPVRALPRDLRQIDAQRMRPRARRRRRGRPNSASLAHGQIGRRRRLLGIIVQGCSRQGRCGQVRWCGLVFRKDQRHRRTDGQVLPDRGDQTLDGSSLEGFNLDCAFLGLDHGHDITAPDHIAGGNQPFHKLSRLHVGAQRWHGEHAHVSALSAYAPHPRSCPAAGSTPVQDARDRGSALRRNRPAPRGHPATRRPVR